MAMNTREKVVKKTLTAKERNAQARAYKLKIYAEHQEEIEFLARASREFRVLNREAITSAWLKAHPTYAKDRYVGTGDYKALMHEDGSMTRMRSMSEVYFFSMLEDEGVAYDYEVPLETPFGVYVADAYLPDLGFYVEVKGAFWVREAQEAKIAYLREQGVSIVIIPSDLIDGEFGF